MFMGNLVKTGCQEIRWLGARFSRVPAHYPDPGNPGHYMNVCKTPNDGQQQSVNDSN